MCRHKLRELGRLAARQFGHRLRYGRCAGKSRQHVKQQHHKDQAGLATVSAQRAVEAPWAGRDIGDGNAQTRRLLIGHVLKIQRRLRRQCIGLSVVLRAGLRQHPRCHARNVTGIHEREPGVPSRKEDAVPTHQFFMERAGEVLHEVGGAQQRVRNTAGRQPPFDLVLRDEPIAFRALHRQEHDVRDAMLPRSLYQIAEVALELRRAQQEEAVTVGQRSVLTGAIKKVERNQLYVRFPIPFFGRNRNIAHSRANLDAFDATQRRNYGRADLTGGTGHEDAFHCALIVELVMAGPTARVN